MPAETSEPVVGIAHDADKDLSDDEVFALVRQSVDAVGGIRKFVRPNDLVVLKPNQTIWFLATDGVTTDPRVVASVVRLCKEAGAGHVVVADSSGGDLKTDRVMEVTGIKRYAQKAGADEVVGFETQPQENVEIDVQGERMDVKVPKVMLEAQCIINLAKAKTHFEDAISCCLKNWVGIIYQKERPRYMVNPLLYDTVAALHKRVPATLNVVDALWAGEGTGPATNDPVWLGSVVAGADPVAVDATVGALLGFQPDELKFAEAAERVGVGTRDPSRIRVVGPKVADIRIHAKRSTTGVEHLPVRVLVGEGVDLAGSVGHFKSVAESFDKYDFWDAINRAYGKPTFMIGAVEDPDFERHLEEGPYFVIDDAALEKYKTDPRVEFIPGHPATHNLFPHIFHRLHVEKVGMKGIKLAGYTKEVEGWFHFTSWKGPKPQAREAR